MGGADHMTGCAHVWDNIARVGGPREIDPAQAVRTARALVGALKDWIPQCGVHLPLELISLVRGATGFDPS